jgi:hypothetical protein
MTVRRDAIRGAVHGSIGGGVGRRSVWATWLACGGAAWEVAPSKPCHRDGVADVWGRHVGLGTGTRARPEDEGLLHRGATMVEGWRGGEERRRSARVGV